MQVWFLTAAFFSAPPQSECEGVRCITKLSRVYIKKTARYLYLTCIFRECNVVLRSMISHIALKIRAASLMGKVTLYLVSTEMRNIEVTWIHVITTVVCMCAYLHTYTSSSLHFRCIKASAWDCVLCHTEKGDSKILLSYSKFSENSLPQ